MSETLPEFANLEQFREWFLAHPGEMGLEVLTKVDESHCVVKLNGRVFRGLLVYDAAGVSPQELLDADLLIATLILSVYVADLRADTFATSTHGVLTLDRFNNAETRVFGHVAKGPVMGGVTRFPFD